MESPSQISPPLGNTLSPNPEDAPRHSSSPSNCSESSLSILTNFPNKIKEEAQPQSETVSEFNSLNIFPSPITIFPKPLGLSYQNFNTNYSTYGYVDGERMEVASCLIVALLEFYFPKPKFKLWRLPFQAMSLIQTVKTEGTIYWVVTVEDKVPKREKEGVFQDKGPDLDGMLIKDNRKGAREDSVFSSAKTRSGNSAITLLVAVVTHQHFRDRTARRIPTVHLFSDALASGQNPNSLIIAERHFRRGHVLVVSGQNNPIRPTMEFYSYDAGNERNASLALTPWFGQIRSQPEGIGMNILPFASNEAEKVDSMFKAILRCIAGEQVLPPPANAQIYPPTSPHAVGTAQHGHEAPRKLAPSTDPARTVNYLSQLRLNKVGRVLDGHTGRLLGRCKEDKAKQLAKEIGFAIPRPMGRRRDKAKKNGSVVRQNMEPMMSENDDEGEKNE